jgi:hypothetical protein
VIDPGFEPAPIAAASRPARKRAANPAPAAPPRLAPGQAVAHAKFGHGTIVSIAGAIGSETALVRFADGAERRLVARVLR